MGDQFFVSYSRADGLEYARKLADDLLTIPPSVPVWLDERELKAGDDWDEQIVEALKTCAGFLYVMTADSVRSSSVCKQEWTRALRYKKPIIPVLFEATAEMPFRLEPRQYIDFSQDYDAALAQLRKRIKWQFSPEGLLRELKDRLADAERDLARSPDDAARIRVENDIAMLTKEISSQEEAIAQPEKVKKRTSDRIESALERERQPTEPVKVTTTTKFINPPPATAPSWFQNRFVETKLIADFIRDDSLRLMTVVGRGGVGKTAMVCRVLKALENGHLPDDLGPLTVNGIVYLSPKGLRQVNLPHLYADLCKLLSADAVKALESAYQNPQASARAKMQALLNAFPQGKVVVLLDNFETVTDTESGELEDAELFESLKALLELPNHGVKVIITTRVAPRSLQLAQPGYQKLIRLEKGLESPHAENILREMNADGGSTLKEASSELLNEARNRTLGYPRALEALASILHLDHTRSLTQLLTDTEKLLPDNVMEALVGEAFCSLNPAFQQVMYALAILGKPVPAGAVDFLLQPYVLGIDSEFLLRELVNRQFVRSDEVGRFHLHEVDRSYALQRISEGITPDQNTKTPPFTRSALLHRAAEYYQTIRTSREHWKTIQDLAPQLTEIELRIACSDFTTAASVLIGIFKYISRWGHFGLLANMHEQFQGHLTNKNQILINLQGLGYCYCTLGNYERSIEYYRQSLKFTRKIKNRSVEGNSLIGIGICHEHTGNYRFSIELYKKALKIAKEVSNHSIEGSASGNLGNCYYSIGEYESAIDCYKHSLAMARESQSRRTEGSTLGNLGNCYARLGNYMHAIDLHKQSLKLKREVGHRSGEGISLYSLGNIYKGLRQSCEAHKYYEKALDIANDIGVKKIQHEARFYSAEAHLFDDNLIAAHKAINNAREYNYPENYAAAWAITGIIRLRLESFEIAVDAFCQGLEEADNLLEMSNKNLSALEAKALSLCGLAICDNPEHLAAAAHVFQAARNITKAKGVVARLLARFDALVVADKDNILAPLRKVAAGE